ncbi:hypothetical protein BG011_007094 [Mortierella polycephala]|uniref:F-box domain-containing protein n=1 Tax=Mortierella polycephala TaxID=41804 RepID=A0A9P6PUF9_9FUNG|nr:hypothetical protein BG011_007094 [Mortierella polycephala]
MELARIPRLQTPTEKALGIPEIVQLIQEQLGRSSLVVSLQVSRLWYHVGHYLVYRTVEWSDNLEGSIVEKMILDNAHRIRTLSCMFHSQAGTNNIDATPLLHTVGVDCDVGPSQEMTTNTGDNSKGGKGIGSTMLTDTSIIHNDYDTTPSVLSCMEPLKIRVSLQRLYLKGHFDLQSSVHTVPRFAAFNIPTLTHLTIRASSNSAMDIQLVLDSATRLQHLMIQSHGIHVDSMPRHIKQVSITETYNCQERAVHQSLLSLIIQYLTISREDLEQIAARCPNLIEFQSLCNPGTLWKQQPAQQYVQQHWHQQQQTSLHYPQQSESSPQVQSTEHRSLVYAMTQSCPRIRRFLVGSQPGGFHIDLIREALVAFPNLETLGIPASDCTKVTMNALKSAQIESSSSSPRVFLTSLCIMNVCSSEKISQAIHDYLCWTPYLKEFYANNTTLYVEQAQRPQTVVESSGQESGPLEQDVAALEIDQRTSRAAPVQQRVSQDTTRDGARNDYRNIPKTRNSLSSMASTATTTEAAKTATVPIKAQAPRQWACTRLETLVVRFARLPWRNLSEPPKRSKDTFAFLAPLQNLKSLCIKEGLTLDAGREYDALQRLKGLEEVVFTTCYPIPIKSADMAWMQGQGVDGTPSQLKRVVVRRQKVNDVLEKEMRDWFKHHRPEVRLSFEQTSTCEEEYSFHH